MVSNRTGGTMIGRGAPFGGSPLMLAPLQWIDRWAFPDRPAIEIPKRCTSQTQDACKL
jgi:hypothetical protein